MINQAERLTEQKNILEIPKRAFNPVYLPYLNNKSRYLVLYGGAGSGKSYFIAERYIIKLIQEPTFNLLVVRAVGDTNRVSTYALFQQIINKWGLSNFFKFNSSMLSMKCLLNGNEVIFKGLDNTEKLKSITFAKGELTDVWIEEASETLEQDFNQLDVRLRGKGTDKQIVLSFNPIDVNHWLKKRFIDVQSEKITFLHTTYKDNNFLDEEYKELLESYRETDPYYYSVYCLGMWGVYGRTIFNAQSVSERLSALKPPLTQGYFIYDDVLSAELGNVIKNIKWVEDENGYIKIYKLADKQTPYVIGGDTSGEGSDFFVGQVLDNTNGQQAATFRNCFDEDLFAKQMYCLGMYYNTALIGIETNFSTYPIRELERLKYPKQYVREREDNYTHKAVEAFGFRTTPLTRPIIIAELVKVCREDIAVINDYDTLNEMLTFVRNEKGKPEASNGAHDDCIMALAVAYYIRPQQSYVKTRLAGEKAKWREQMYTDYYAANDEDKTYLIKKWGNPF